LGYKVFKKWKLQEEGTMLDFLSNEGREKLKERAKEVGFFGGLREVLFDPFGVNPFW